MIVLDPSLGTIDSDGDSVIDLEDAFIYDPLEWLDTDLDEAGNNADLDDDDGITDVFEDANVLDSLDAGDASEDSDGDGLTNLE